MTQKTRRAATSALTALTVCVITACASGTKSVQSTQPASVAVKGNTAAAANAKPDSTRYPFTKADVDFMSGMIHHHAQAIAMSKLAPTHGASSTMLTLAGRIINAQTDEITLMSNWLRDRNQPIPDPSTPTMSMNMNGMQHTMLMPGMLSEEQMKELDAARGPEFDKLFLKYMIQHHQGALQMVNDVQHTNGAGQDEMTFKLTSDVYADQSTEIARMQKMLAQLTFGGSAP